MTGPDAPRDPRGDRPALGVRRRLAGLRALQVFGLSLAGLTLGGLALLSTGGYAPEAAAGSVAPRFSVLLAGRDIVYCYYRQPCKDQDQRTGLAQPPNTDTVMLVKVDGSQVTVLSIPRDTNVGEFDPQRSRAEQKVNSQYFSGGPEALLRAAETITGEPVRSYVIVRTDYVERVIDALGGLDVTVPEGGIEWVDQAAGVNLKLAPGEHHLNGKDAALFLRVRKGFGDDYGRIDHQKQALTQLAARLRSAQGLAALPTILGGIGNGVETNLDPNLLTAMRPFLPQMKLSFATLPTDPIPGTFNLAVNRERLAAVWGDAGAQAPTPTALPDVRVRIEDASGAKLGLTLQRALKALGYAQVSTVTIPESREASQVFTQDAVTEATFLAGALNLPRLQGERFPVGPREIGIYLTADARDHLPALARMRDAFAAAGAPDLTAPTQPTTETP
ncbi:LCP family protein [Deinococcus enclensis]|uniref:LCP family protein required for cell wall assembly n=1 Tax=Deinococcus enclensis TaxID=1049582 RepID=A0ABT9MDQ4_9DEIO|nr:LCP family protein [Deinococcus enclensis]MDP9764743.1 LCP family protein required for cell wall assembly [Deinococcus enclensis]